MAQPICETWWESACRVCQNVQLLAALHSSHGARAFASSGLPQSAGVTHFALLTTAVFGKECLHHIAELFVSPGLSGFASFQW